MKIIILLAVVCGTFAVPIEYYTTANDHLDIQAVVDDPIKLKAMTGCFLDRSPCDPVAMSYKVLIPDVLKTACQRCNDAQKHLGKTYITGLTAKSPEDYDEIAKKYDPEGKYLAKFMEAVKDY